MHTDIQENSMYRLANSLGQCSPYYWSLLQVRALSRRVVGAILSQRHGSKK